MTAQCLHTCRWSRHGDGKVNRSDGELCDDARSAACGTCASCKQIAPRAAQGSIDVVNAASIVAGDTITIDDGTSQAVLEFSDGSGSCAIPSAHCIDMLNVEVSNGAVASRIVVPDITGAVAVGVGNSHSCALVTGGTVKCWGDNLCGQLGLDPALVQTSGTPVTITF